MLHGCNAWRSAAAACTATCGQHAQVNGASLTPWLCGMPSTSTRFQGASSTHTFALLTCTSYRMTFSGCMQIIHQHVGAPCMQASGPHKEGVSAEGHTADASGPTAESGGLGGSTLG